MKLHLGCWNRYIPGFVHVDYSDMPHIDYCSAVDQLDFIADESVDLIYCSHTLSYIEPEHVNSAMSEWWRVLKPNGILRISTINLTELWKVYQSTGDIATFLNPVFGKMTIESQEGTKKIRHQMHYDEKTLTKLFTHNRYYQIEHWDWKNTEHSDIDDYSQSYWPHMQKDTGIMLSLNMQAKKFKRPTT